MAGVKIHTAPPLDTPLFQLDPRTAQTHAMLRALDILNRLSDDCRPIAALISEAEGARWLGYSGRDEFISESFGKPVEVVEMALEGLDLFDPAKPVRFDDAVQAGRTAREKMQRAEPLAKHGNQPGEMNSRNKGSDTTSVDVGRGADYLAARIKRDRPDIAQRVEAGEYKSIRAAAIDAGIVKPACPVKAAQRAFSKMTTDQQADFLIWCHEFGG